MNTSTKTRTRVKEQAHIDVEISKGAMIAMSTVSGIIGIWAAACFVGALFAAGGPLGVIKGWFQAVTGL